MFAWMLALSVAAAAGPGHAWTARTVPLRRWPDAEEVVVATLDPGTEVEVLVEDGDLVRVRRGTDFGWVPADALSDAPPAGSGDERGGG